MFSVVNLTTALFFIFLPCLCTGQLHLNAAIRIMAGAGGLFASCLVGWKFGYPWGARCGHSWTNFNATNFKDHLEEYLYGQHLVTWVVARTLMTHISKTEPNKALVMSFHGWTGSGKNYASKIIARTLYSKAAQSEYVHWYIGTRDFPHLSEMDKYRDRLQKEIPEYTKKCGQSLFIFDEMDKMEPGIIDAIKPFIDYHDEIDGIDYRRNIFIFLSNAGGSEITRVAYNFWMDGKDREDINMRDIEPLINQGAFNEIGGLQYSEIVVKNLIDVYVPFLPLERVHVKKCIAYELKIREQDANNELINKIADQIVYYPPEIDLFSVSGCKKISHKVDVYGSSGI